MVETLAEVVLTEDVVCLRRGFEGDGGIGLSRTAEAGAYICDSQHRRTAPKPSRASALCRLPFAASSLCDARSRQVALH